MSTKEEYEALIAERGWEIKTVRPYYTGNHLLEIVNPSKGLEASQELLYRELPNKEGWTYWKLLHAEAEALKEKVECDLQSAFEKSAWDKVSLVFDIPDDWYEAQRLENMAINVYAELRTHGKQEVV